VRVRRTVVGGLAAARPPVVADQSHLRVEDGLVDQLALFGRRPAADQLDAATLSITNGDAAIVPRLEGACGAQAGWTLLQFPTVSRVNGAARSDLEQRAPAILVDSPVPFQAVSSPLRVAGTANTFEATFEYDLLGGHGEKLAHHFVTATSGNGMRGTFDVTIPFDVGRAVEGELVVYESSAEDGSRINIRRTPLRLQPS